MERLKPSLVRKKCPVRFWVFVAFIVGVPNFIKFDSSGLTHNEGLFNPTSIMVILLTLISGAFMAVVTLLSRGRILQRKIDYSWGLWICMLITLLISSFLQPRSHLSPMKATDLPLSLYRLCEWVLAFVMLLSLYTREAEDRTTDLVIHLIGIVCWANVLMVWLVLPIRPSLVYASPGDESVTYPRLGGIMIHPVQLSVLAGIAFFHALIFMRGPKKLLACGLAFVTLVLTYARSELGIFMILLLIYAMVLSRSALMRWSTMLGGITVGLLGIIFQEKVINYLARGHGTNNITTLSERTLVWEAARKAIVLRPWIGYGFAAGARNALRDQWNATNWIPPHAHNELLQALLSGGIPAGILLLAIYGRVLWLGVKGAKHGNKNVFLLIVLLQIFFMAFITLVISGTVSKVSLLFLITFVGIVAQPRLAKVRVARRARTIEAPGWRIASPLIAARSTSQYTGSR